MPGIIALWLVLFSHLTVDKGIPDTTKTGAFAVVGILGLVYFVFGLCI